MDSLRDSLRTGHTLDELVRMASAAQDGRRAGHDTGRGERDWLVESLLGAKSQQDESEKRQELEKLKSYIKDHVKAYARGIQCLLAVVLFLQLVCLVRLFWVQ